MAAVAVVSIKNITGKDLKSFIGDTFAERKNGPSFDGTKFLRHFALAGEKPAFEEPEAQESAQSFLRTIKGSRFSKWDCFEPSTKRVSDTNCSADLCNGRRPIEHGLRTIHFGNGLFFLSAKFERDLRSGNAGLDHDLR
jgi:hypothetical protein